MTATKTKLVATRLDFNQVPNFESEKKALAMTDAQLLRYIVGEYFLMKTSPVQYLMKHTVRKAVPQVST